MTVTAEFPFIQVTIDTRGLQPVARRAIGNVAVVGDAGGFGTATPNVPVMVGSEAEARTLFADTDAVTGAITNKGRLYDSLKTVLLQDPAPSRVYAVATADSGGNPDYAAALAVVAAAPVQFVCLANETDAAALELLKDHVETVSADGNRRMGVGMVDPDLAVGDGETFPGNADTTYGDAKSDVGRMILVAARVETEGGLPEIDVAAAAMGTIAGYNVHISVLMKQVRGPKIPVHRQFTASETKALAERFIIPLIDPELIVGEGLFLGSGRAYTTDPSRLYVDVTRTVDHITSQLQAGLIGSIGNVRIDRLGMQALRSRFDAILQPLQTARVIDSYTVDIPVLPILEAEEAARTPGQAETLTTARTSRVVEVLLSVTYAGAVHFLDIDLALKA